MPKHPSITRIQSLPGSLVTGLLLLIATSQPGCKAVGPDVIAAAAVATTLAVGAAVINKELGGCYSVCEHGYACNPRTGLCEKVPCGGCPVDMMCDTDQDPPECVPIQTTSIRIRSSAPGPGEPEGAGGPRTAPGEGDPPGCLRITHAHPVWPTPATYQPARPLFFVRTNRPVDPEALLAQTQVALGEAGFESRRFRLLDSFLVLCPQGTCTDVFFQLEGDLEPGKMVAWRVAGASEASLGPACPGVDTDGAYLFAKFLTADATHPEGSPAGFWSEDQLALTYGSEKAADMLRAQDQVLGILDGYGNRDGTP